MRIANRITALSTAALTSAAGLIALATAPRIAVAEPAPTREVAFQGATLRYTLIPANDADAREKTPIVFVHGWASSRKFWRHQLAGLAGKRTLLALDLPGNGDSDDVEAEHSMSLYADAIAAVMDDADVKRAILVGHSNGTPTVRQFYRRYPQRVAALVTVDGALKQVFPPEMAATFLKQFESDDYLTVARGVIDQSLSQMRSAEDADLVRKTMLGTSQRVMLGGMKAAMDDAIWVDDRINVPLLVINSANPFWSEEYVQQVKALSDDVEYHVFEGVSHLVMMDAPDKFNNTLLAFLVKRGL